MVLGKPSVLGRPTNLDYSRARAYRAYSRCGWGMFGHFFLSSGFQVALKFLKNPNFLGLPKIPKKTL